MLHTLYLLFIAPLEFLLRLVLEWGFTLTHSWGVSLVLLSFVVNTAVLPIYNRAETWQEEERELKRRMARNEGMIRGNSRGWERFALLSTLRRLHGYTWRITLRASFGLLLQIPFFFAAFHLLSHYTALNGQSLGPLGDLGAPDGLLSIGGFRVNALPIAMTAVNLFSAFFYTRNLTRRDKGQIYGMALLFLVLLYNAASALTLYWTLNNVYSLVKNIVEKDLMRRPWWGRAQAFWQGIGKAGPLLSRLRSTLCCSFGVGALFWLYICSVACERHGLALDGALLAAASHLAGQTLLASLAAAAFLVLLADCRPRREAASRAVFFCASTAALFLALASQAQWNDWEETRQLAVLWDGPCLLLFACWTGGVLFIWNAWGQMSFNARHEQEPNGWLILVFSISFMTCVFAPLTAYFANSSEFWFGIPHLLPIIVTSFCVLFFSLYFLSRQLIGKDLVIVIYGLLLTLYIYFHVQGNYIPRSYGWLDGSEINWSQYRLYEILTIVNIFFFVGFFIITVYFFRNKIYRFGGYLCRVFILIQIITLLFAGYENISKQFDNKSPVVVSDEGIFQYSRSNNVIIFIIDSFDAEFMRTLWAGDYKDKLENIFTDFTWYPDTAGAYPFTRESLPFILTGTWYNNKQNFNSYLKSAYNNQKLFKLMKEEDYTIGIYTSYNHVYPLQDYFVNIKKGTYKLTNSFGFSLKLCQLIAFNYMPHWIKKYLYITNYEFEEFKSVKQGYSLYSVDDIKFYNRIKNQDIVLQQNNSFHLYHLDGVHPPYTFGEYLQTEPDKKYTAIDASRGCIMLVSEYLKKLKEFGVYDNTSVVIMSDHGHFNYRSNPLFMLKQANVNHNFIISNKKMSFEWLQDIIYNLISKIEIDDKVIENYLDNSNNKRRYIWYSSETHGNMLELVIGDNIKNTINYYPSGKYYVKYGNKDTFHTYYLGRKLNFVKNNDDFKYCLFGWTRDDAGIRPTGLYSLMRFVINEECKNGIWITFEYSTVETAPFIGVSLNDHPATGFIADAHGTKTVYIDNNDITKEILLRFHFDENSATRAGMIPPPRFFIKNIAVSSEDPMARPSTN